MSLSLNKRYEMVFLHEHPEGPKWGYAKIASYVHCSRPRKTTKAQDKRIVKMATEKHNITSTEIKNKLEKKGVEVSSRTIRRRLVK
ncbi:unnamed protein product [Rhizophagus irregularis]|uniref:Transposase Tc1-like domain-containing protein n=1 Tax=Rhizophagus irregularis TaxID=588596 RepID=A0A915YZX6_9GLOM|nr:unnamed protein product [Rhizophagus irregularis]CAB5354788.1 unnamed protein product [Rhizophagus irregularis]